MSILKKLSDGRVFGTYPKEGKVVFEEGASNHFSLALSADDLRELAIEIKALANELTPDVAPVGQNGKRRTLNSPPGLRGHAR